MCRSTVIVGVGDIVPGHADKVGIALTQHLKLEAAYEKLAEMQWKRSGARGWRHVVKIQEVEFVRTLTS